MKIDPRREIIRKAQGIVSADIGRHLRDRKANKATKKDEAAYIEDMRALASNLRNVADRLSSKADEMHEHYAEGRTARLSIAKQEAERIVSEARVFLLKGK